MSRGGNSGHVTKDISKNVVAIVKNSVAMAALVQNSSTQYVIAWGTYMGPDYVANSTLSSLSSGVASIIANEVAFCALKENGEVVPFGRGDFGGSFSSTYVSPLLLNDILASPVQSVYANKNAFAAVKVDGTVATWGQAAAGGGVSTRTLPALVNISQVYGNGLAFVGLRSDGTLISWGSTLYGGGVSVHHRIHAVWANNAAFAFLTNQNQLVTIGDPYTGGNVTLPGASTVRNIIGTAGAFAALHMDGTVQVWGNPLFGGDPMSLPTNMTNVTQIVANNGAFAAINVFGAVFTWGDAEAGGDSSAVSNMLQYGVVNVTASEWAFAALTFDGGVVTWGHPQFGGDSAAVQSKLYNVTQICGNKAAFAAVRQDPATTWTGSQRYSAAASVVVTWGDKRFGGGKAPVVLGSQLPVTCF